MAEPTPAETQKGQPDLVSAALFGLCPQCGAKSLYAGVARFAPCCPACGLDYSGYNVGDGPAALLTLLIGTVILIAALFVEFTFTPPFWVHILLWVPITIAAVVWSLRVAKAGLLYLEHRHKAAEARLADPDAADDKAAQEAKDAAQ